MHVKRATVNGSSNIGLYGYVNDNVGIIGKAVSDTVRDDIEDILDIPVIATTIAGTNLIGAFVTGHNDTIIVPDIIQDHEAEALEDAPVHVAHLPTTYTCLGNNILTSSEAAMCSPELSQAAMKRAEEALDVEATQGQLGDVNTVGTLAVFNHDAGKSVISNDVSDADYERFTEHFDTEATPSSVNMGAAQLRCGVLCNKNGFLVGDASGGPEITTIDRGLGYL